jgi:excisionase family DNA binding protein
MASQLSPFCLHTKRGDSGLKDCIEKFLYTRNEAAHALGLSLRSVAYLIQQQRLATRRIGSRVLIHKDELRRFARGHHTDAIAVAA